MTSLLLVEDDRSLGETISSRLSKSGYEISWAQSVEEALSLCRKTSFSAAIIDIGLPDGDGFALARQLRTEYRFPFLFLTAMNSAEFRLEGFEIGAADYIPKPFHYKELLLRLEQVIDREAEAATVTTEYFTVDLSSLTLRYQDGTIARPLEKDLRLLKHLVDVSPRIVSREEVLDEVWRSGEKGNQRSVDNAVVRLRQLLEKTGKDLIRSVRGVGYQFELSN